MAFTLRWTLVGIPQSKHKNSDRNPVSLASRNREWTDAEKGNL